MQETAANQAWGSAKRSELDRATPPARQKFRSIHPTTKALALSRPGEGKAEGGCHPAQAEHPRERSGC